MTVDLWRKMERAATNKLHRQGLLDRVMKKHPYVKADKGADGKFVKAKRPAKPYYRPHITGHQDSYRAAAAARLSEIPPDTRTPAQQLLGDPIPNDPRRAYLDPKRREVTG